MIVRRCPNCGRKCQRRMCGVCNILADEVEETQLVNEHTNWYVVKTLLNREAHYKAIEITPETEVKENVLGLWGPMDHARANKMAIQLNKGSWDEDSDYVSIYKL